LSLTEKFLSEQRGAIIDVVKAYKRTLLIAFNREAKGK
jgi:hypothetical protein